MKTIDSVTGAADAANRFLRSTGAAWLAVAAVGQAAFIYFIVAFYGVRTATGNFAAWNDKSLIDGHIPGDRTGNAVFAAHVLLAAVVTLGGLMQMVPAVRKAAPAVHRWTGRAFLAIGCFMALSGAWLTLVRGTYLSLISAVAILIDAVLILVFAGLALHHARRRQWRQHQAWAMRTFMVVSGVWFLRVGLMGWVILNGGPVGMNNTLSGPADVVLLFGSYLIPLAVLELYLAAGPSPSAPRKIAVGVLVLLATSFTAVGAFGTVTLMWARHL